MNAVDVILICVALSMDACALTIANCSTYKNLFKEKKAWSMPVFFALFQGLMPLIGFFVGSLFAKYLQSIGVQTIIVTDISKDGTLGGPNLEMLKKLMENVNINIIASGGIKDIEDIKKLKEMGVYGAISGKAMYYKTLSLKEAIQVAKED